LKESRTKLFSYINTFKSLLKESRIKSAAAIGC
jgi:hypothetical protein